MTGNNLQKSGTLEAVAATTMDEAQRDAEENS
jgi:hypothetical protein